MKAKRSKVFKPIMLSLAVSGLMYDVLLPQAVANDLDIYRPAVEGKTTLVLMLDTSGSMGSNDSGQTGSRLTRLKNAMYQLLDDPTIKNDVVMGLAQYSSQSKADGSSMSADGNSGKMILAAQPLTTAHRQAMKAAIAAMSATGGTPTPQAYAEAAAYLMGTTTKTTSTVRNVVYARYGSSSTYYKCNTNRDPEQSGSVWYSYCNSFDNSQSSVPVSGASGYYTSGSYRYYYTEGTGLISITGSGFDYSATATKSGGQYVSPLPARSDSDECNGQGIYFLTDGVPEPGNSNSEELMRSALNSNGFNSPSSGLTGGQHSRAAWNNTGEFSKWLLDKTKNPAGVEIKTAVVGFGSVFAGVQPTLLQNPSNGKNRAYYNCNLFSSQDAKNACNWGEKTHPDRPGVGGYGEGGFYYAASTQDIVDSVKNFIDELKKDIPAVPTGAVVVPQDTLAPDSLQPYAYLPLLEPKPGTSNVVWPGNVKKYDVKNGTVYGKNGNLVFNGDGIFATNTYDRWSVDNVDDKGIIQKGGTFENLPMPTNKNTLERNVWLERSATSTTLDQVKPTIVGMNALSGVTNWQRRYLLNFMGYNLPEVGSLTEALNALPSTLPRPVEPFRVMGGVVHSTPQLMTYSANLNADGSLSDNRDESLLFGSLEGALHVMNAKSGVEQMAFIPRQIIDNQPRALLPDATGLLSPASTEVPSPTAYGVDAPWTAYAQYSRKANKIEADFMYAYGGMRMGGNAFYGMDLSSLTSPKILFNITPSTSGFTRLGQTWGKPVVTRIRHNNQTKLVVVISGGYDIDYEKTDKNRSTGTDVKGNAVYIIDAKTGERLLTIGKTGQGANLSHAEMKFSVVGQVTALDRDSDGLTDHLYFADLGGQVFRVELQNTPNTAVANFGTRVTRLANLTAANGSGKPGPRFYEAPVVTIHDEGSKRFAVVNVGSGDRSNPLYDENTIPNRVYGVIDRDVARNDLYSTSISMNSENIELTSLIEKPTTATHKAAMLSDGSDRKNGWYYPLDGFGTNNSGLKGLKAFNEGAAIRNDLYMAVYNPNITNNGANKCSAQVLGGTELHRYCLPFGVCATGVNNLQRFNLGQGIQAVNFGPGDDPQTRRLIYQQPTTEVKELLTGTAQSQHKEYSAPPRLVPIRWYEKQPKLNP